MPELAEVETVRNTLKKQVLNKKINNIEILYPNIIEKDSINLNNIIGDYFIDIKRKGKYLLFELKNYYLISHLRMEGKFFIKDNKEAPVKHEHVIFHFDDISLRYHDTRKFGRMKLIKKDELEACFHNIGPDANSDVNVEIIYEKIKKSNKYIKTILLDQSIIAGLGNIYADEVLFLSKISPLRKGNSISLSDTVNICNNSKVILNKAIELKGTTIRSYTSSLNVYGMYQDFLNVHTKAGQKCPLCNEFIVKEKINGRTSYYCQNCQK